MVLLRVSAPSPTPPACVICGCSCMAPTPEHPPSARPDALLYFHLFRCFGPRGGANLLATLLLRAAGRLRTPLPPPTGGLADGRALVLLACFFPPTRASPSWSRFRVFPPSLQCASFPCQQPTQPIISSIVALGCQRGASATLLRW